MFAVYVLLLPRRWAWRRRYDGRWWPWRWHTQRWLPGCNCMWPAALAAAAVADYGDCGSTNEQAHDTTCHNYQSSGSQAPDRTEVNWVVEYTVLSCDDAYYVVYRWG
jgi:hypothetical protein